MIFANLSLVQIIFNILVCVLNTIFFFLFTGNYCQIIQVFFFNFSPQMTVLTFNFIFFIWHKNGKVLVLMFSVNTSPNFFFFLCYASFCNVSFRTFSSAIKSSQQGNYHEQCQLLTNYQSLMAFGVFRMAILVPSERFGSTQN